MEALKKKKIPEMFFVDQYSKWKEDKWGEDSKKEQEEERKRRWSDWWVLRWLIFRLINGLCVSVCLTPGGTLALLLTPTGPH